MFYSFLMSIHYIHVFGTHLKLKEKKIVTVIRKVCPSDLWTKIVKMKQLKSSFQILARTRKRTEWKFNKLDERVDFSNLPFNICIENLKPNV